MIGLLLTLLGIVELAIASSQHSVVSIVVLAVAGVVNLVLGFALLND